jgi:hypothetical protein
MTLQLGLAVGLVSMAAVFVGAGFNQQLDSAQTASTGSSAPAFQ